jgi:hypothetical protein
LKKELSLNHLSKLNIMDNVIHVNITLDRAASSSGFSCRIVFLNTVINQSIIITTLFYKIPPHLPLPAFGRKKIPKGGTIPLFGRRPRLRPRGASAPEGGPLSEP